MNEQLTITTPFQQPAQPKTNVSAHQAFSSGNYNSVTVTGAGESVEPSYQPASLAQMDASNRAFQKQVYTSNPSQSGVNVRRENGSAKLGTTLDETDYVRGIGGLEMQVSDWVNAGYSIEQVSEMAFGKPYVAPSADQAARRDAERNLAHARNPQAIPGDVLVNVRGLQAHVSDFLKMGISAAEIRESMITQANSVLGIRDGSKPNVQQMDQPKTPKVEPTKSEQVPGLKLVEDDTKSVKIVSEFTQSIGKELAGGLMMSAIDNLVDGNDNPSTWNVDLDSIATKANLSKDVLLETFSQAWGELRDGLLFKLENTAMGEALVYQGVDLNDFINDLAFSNPAGLKRALQTALVTGSVKGLEVMAEGYLNVRSR